MYNIQANFIAWIYIICVILLINKGSAKECVNKNATQDSQYIYSHSGFNSVEKYPSNTDECWVIHADPAIFGNEVRIQLKMMEFHLEDSTYCTLDYVEIYSGENSDSGSKIIGTYCGKYQPWKYSYHASNVKIFISVVSNGNYMYVKFISDSGKESTGFKMKYKATLVNSHGDITSPVSVNGCYYLEADAMERTFYSHKGYPRKKYPSLYDACWIIHVSPDVPQPTFGVKLWTDEFTVEYNANCALDYVSVYNGDNKVSAPLLNKFCGNIAFTVNSLDSFMFVHFHSDKSEVFSGFSLKYTTVLVDQYKSGWKIALIVIAAIIGGVILIGLFLLVVYNEEIKKWWPTRSICRCNCTKKKHYEADTEADEVEGACAMNLIHSTTTVTDTAVQQPKKDKISADRSSDADESVNSEEEGDRPSKKLKNKSQQKVQDTSKINVTIDPPPYATEIEDDPPPPYVPDQTNI